MKVDRWQCSISVIHSAYGRAMTTRIPPLVGALNFRDLGGYLGADGRKTRWNTLFRSGTTHAMTPEDVALLSAYGIRYAYDLRSNEERRAYPTRLREIAELEYRFRDHDQLTGDIGRLLNSPDTGAEHSRQFMISMYRRLPYEFEGAFRSLFQFLSDGDLPLVFNCTAGKDRTGVAAALVLTALGVARETVLEDYLLTEQFLDRSYQLVLGKNNMTQFGGTDLVLWEPLMRAHPEYLNAMFDRLQESHGSVEGYFRERLAIDAKTLGPMRDNLLD
jgi:protein-tyrosine phosphatase